MTQCCFENCKQENILVWLNKPLCSKHWQWVTEHKEKAIKMFGIKQTKEEPIVSKTETVAAVAEPEVVKALEAENAAEAVAEATTTEVSKDKVKRERYNDELDKRILELDGLKKSITEISKDIGRSYASTMYRLRKLRGGDKVEESTAEATSTVKE